MGLRFARKLLEQVGASLTLRSATGRTVWTIALPEEPKVEASRRAGVAACR